MKPHRFGPLAVMAALLTMGCEEKETEDNWFDESTETTDPSVDPGATGEESSGETAGSGGSTGGSSDGGSTG